MGLDGVELVMTIESIFEISIPDEEAQKMHSPGQVRDFVCQQLAKRRPGCQTLRIFQQARQLLIQAGWKRSEVTLDSPLLGKHFPWKALEKRVGRRLSRPSTRWWVWLSGGEEKFTLREMLKICAPRDWHWTPDKVWEEVASAVSETIGIPVGLVTPTADFFADLGMS